MTTFIDLEHVTDPCSLHEAFDLIVIGGGAAGLTLVKELSGCGLRILVLESGALEESAEHDELNAVEVVDALQDAALQKARQDMHGPQLTHWSSEIQKFGVRCRVLGGSTVGWAGKVAPFSAMDHTERPWIANSGWPVSRSALRPYLARAAKHLDLGPLSLEPSFWERAGIKTPPPMQRMGQFESFFWQFARSRTSLSDVMRFGPDFRREHHKGVTVLYNATACRIVSDENRVTGVAVKSSLTGGKELTVEADVIVLAAGAIENARLLLMSSTNDGSTLGNAHDVIGRYLTDHPSMRLGYFSAATMQKAAALFGLFPLQDSYRVYMYSHGLALKPDAQKAHTLPNLAVYSMTKISADDPLAALKRLLDGKSKKSVSDLRLVFGSAPSVISAFGRKLVNYEKIPRPMRQLIVDMTIKINANFVARDYISRGRGRKIEALSLNIICEQPPIAQNRITLSEKTDRLGLPLPHVDWHIQPELRRDIATFAALLENELTSAGVEGFALLDSIRGDGIASLPIHDMAHTAGTTRMGTDPTVSVVDPNGKLHGVEGLYVGGASVFPTSGHANPTLMILALTVRLADHLKERLLASRLARLPVPSLAQSNRPLVVVTGATGRLGRAIVEELSAQNFRIRGTFRRTMPDDPRIAWIQIDFADPDLTDGTLTALVDGADAVIHLAASLSNVAEMEVANVANLKRFAEICAISRVRSFCQASSMVVYGSPKQRLVSEESPVLDLDRPLHKQYYAESYMRHYAASKLRGEQVLTNVAGDMRVTLGRIAVASDPEFLDRSLAWGQKRRLLQLYRNSHYIAPPTVARAFIHFMKRALSSSVPPVEIVNICNSRAPSFAAYRRSKLNRTGFYVPYVFDILKGIVISRSISLRYPIGMFRLSDHKLRSTSFSFEADDIDQSNG